VSARNPEDEINHPSHYTHSAIETIEAIEAWFPGVSFHMATAVKYLSRGGHKIEAGSDASAALIKDLKKAAWYINRAIAYLEKVQR
jgi:hypothetical protein